MLEQLDRTVDDGGVVTAARRGEQELIVPLVLAPVGLEQRQHVDLGAARPGRVYPGMAAHVGRGVDDEGDGARAFQQRARRLVRQTNLRRGTAQPARDPAQQRTQRAHAVFLIYGGLRIAERGAPWRVTIYGIKNCDTMKKARAWLDGHGVAYEFHDYKTQGIARPKLEAWAKQVGWEVLLNRAGTTFRALPDADKQGLTEKKAIALMAAQPSMIKRPVLETGGDAPRRLQAGRLRRGVALTLVRVMFP